MLRNTKHSYGAVAKFFHWATFIAIAGMLAVGFIMSDMETTPDKFKLVGLHKAVGMLLLLFVLARLAWKSVNPSPALPSHLNRLQEFAAKATHALLYALIIAMILTGWAGSSAAGFPVSVFGWFTMPSLFEPNKELLHIIKDAHENIAYLIMATVGLHVGAALLHHFYYGDNVLRRMLPFTKGESDVENSDLDGC